MEYMKIAVVTDDRAYGEAVSRSLLIGNRNFDLSLHSRRGFCRRWQQAGQPFRESFDLVLWDGEGLEKVYGGNLVWLTDRVSQLRDPSEGKGDSFGPRREERYAIYKYSPSSVMVAAIFEIYGKLTGRRPAGTRPDRVEIFAFASWQGGCGCTTVAMAVGQELVRFYRRRVLYLSLEGTESTALYMDAREGMKTAGEYLYHLSAAEERGGEGTPFLEEYLIRDSYGVEAFAPAGSCNPLGMARPEEIRRLLPALMSSGRFDAIVIDAGCGTGASVREAMSFADRICLVYSREERDRQARYLSFLVHGLGADMTGEEGGSAAAAGRSPGRPEAASAGHRAAGTAESPAGKPGSRRKAAAGERTAGHRAAGTAESSAGAGPRVLRILNRQDPAADPPAPASARPGEETGGPAARISEREISGGDLLLEGRFGRDIHKLTELLYRSNMYSY